MATLVFKTLRVGFPTAKVQVDINPTTEPERAAIEAAARGVGALTASVDTIHHEWIGKLLVREVEPFFIVDTDVVFYENFERFKFDNGLAGWRIPEWKDAFSKAVTRARLHTSLLYLDPQWIGANLAAFASTLPEGPFTPFANPIFPLCLPFKGRMYFYDTASLLYHAIGGQPFTDEQKDAYFHFNFGTIPDLVLPRLDEASRAQMLARRQAILDNPERGRGVWREQEQYYAANQL